MKYRKAWSTHMPLLIRAVQMTSGPVMELGAGMFSTPLLHWLCAEDRRKLFTYEDSPEYYKFAKQFQSRNHAIFQVNSYDEIDTKRHWSVIFVDHGADRRATDIIRLKDKADYIVIHDTHSDAYDYDKIWKHFKHVYHWKFSKPWTSVVSNFHRLDAFGEPVKISEILKELNTDKNLCYKGTHCYGKAYDGLFNSYDKNAKLDIIEIGTGYGDSLLAWRDFFPNANITGVDIEDKVKNKRSDIEYIVSDVKKMKPKKKYDIVIDDGSHKLNDVVHTVENFKLKEGGMMIIEDCQAPSHWYERVSTITNYAIETIDMRAVNKQHDDFMIVLRNYGYYQ